jgi:hypothetical protein
MAEPDSDTLNRLAENERHFHTIQAGVRGLSSTWTLAAFASIAVLLKQEEKVQWLLSPFALVILVCLMANIGLSILWIIDQPVCQRLFNTNYIAGLRLEQRYSVIPPVRAIQAFSIVRRKSIASSVKFFYIGPMVPLAAMAMTAAYIFGQKPSSHVAGLLGYIVALFCIAPIVWVVIRTREVDFIHFAKSLPGDYSVILERENCRAIIERHLKTLTPVAKQDDK